MGFFLTFALVSLAFVAIMITRQAEVLASGSAHTAQSFFLGTIRRNLVAWWHLMIEWVVLLSKRSSQVAALLLAKSAHAISTKISKLVVLLHRHGRSK